MDTIPKLSGNGLHEVHPRGPEQAPEFKPLTGKTTFPYCLYIIDPNVFILYEAHGGSGGHVSLCKYDRTNTLCLLHWLAGWFGYLGLCGGVGDGIDSSRRFWIKQPFIF